MKTMITMITSALVMTMMTTRSKTIVLTTFINHIPFVYIYKEKLRTSLSGLLGTVSAQEFS